MIHPLRTTAAAVITTAAAVVLLTGCSSGGDQQAAPPAADGGSVPSTAPAAPTSDSGPSADPSAPQPTVPVAQLTPVTGKFTAPQKRYLTGRVPKGTDPAAVLEVGQESCDRIASVAKRDPDAAASGIVLGQITGAHDAVATLCPAQRPVLDRAERGFPDGTFTVGTRTATATGVVSPGRYLVPGATKACSWRLTAANGSSTSGTAGAVTVPAGARGFTSTGCSVWLPAKGT